MMLGERFYRAVLLATYVPHSDAIDEVDGDCVLPHMHSDLDAALPSLCMLPPFSYSSIRGPRVKPPSSFVQGYVVER